MRLLLCVPLALSACLAPDAETAEVASPVIEYQGLEYQGIEYQGIEYQGIEYQGTAFDGASYEGGSLVDGTVTGTELVAWRRIGVGKAAAWEQRTPTQLCIWDFSRLVRRSCTSYTLGSQPSPLAGSTWQAQFTDENDQPITLTLRIGNSPRDLLAVRRDSSSAMFQLAGHETYCGLDHRSSCDPVHGCHRNCDLYLYDVQVITPGHEGPLCPAGELAYALHDTWDRTGQRVPSATTFTFTCTNGTIAKCTRWGYRPFGSARKCSWSTCSSSEEPTELADYHQACIRAATADYCASGHSYTKNGTLVDVYDYEPQIPGSKGFVPRTASVAYLQGLPPATALQRESAFDQLGATWVEHMRYYDAGTILNWGTGCPQRLSPPILDYDGTTLVPSQRSFPAPTYPQVAVDSTPVCAHSELTVGRRMHPECSACTFEMWLQPELKHCILDGWTQACVDAAASCSSARMTSHSECTSGSALPIYSTGCTLKVCLANPSCCSGSWTSACVGAADQTCTGGRESPLLGRGFCGFTLPSQPG